MFKSAQFDPPPALLEDNGEIEEDSQDQNQDPSPAAEVIQEATDEDSADDDLLEVAVDLGQGKEDVIRVAPGDNVETLVDAFCQKHGIGATLRTKLLEQIRLQMEESEGRSGKGESQVPESAPPKNAMEESSENITEEADDVANDRLFKSFGMVELQRTKHIKNVCTQGDSLKDSSNSRGITTGSKRKVEHGAASSRRTEAVREGGEAAGILGTVPAERAGGSRAGRGPRGYLPSQDQPRPLSSRGA